MMKNVAKSLAKPLVSLYNRLLNQNHFPKIYKYSHVIRIIPLYKKGERFLPSNYRPVALLSNLGKGMERIIFKRIFNFLSDDNL